MKAIKVMGTINEGGKLALDAPLLIDKNLRVEVIVLIPETADNNSDEGESKAEILKDFRQAWHEAMTGKTIPVAEIWEEIDDE